MAPLGAPEIGAGMVSSLYQSTRQALQLADYPYLPSLAHLAHIIHLLERKYPASRLGLGRFSR